MDDKQPFPTWVQGEPVQIVPESWQGTMRITLPANVQLVGGELDIIQIIPHASGNRTVLLENHSRNERTER